MLPLPLQHLARNHGLRPQHGAHLCQPVVRPQPLAPLEEGQPLQKAHPLQQRLAVQRGDQVDEVVARNDDHFNLAAVVALRVHRGGFQPTVQQRQLRGAVWRLDDAVGQVVLDGPAAEQRARENDVDALALLPPRRQDVARCDHAVL
jgi:hypothetical protein